MLFRNTYRRKVGQGNNSYSQIYFFFFYRSKQIHNSPYFSFSLLFLILSLKKFSDSSMLIRAIVSSSRFFLFMKPSWISPSPSIVHVHLFFYVQDDHIIYCQTGTLLRAKESTLNNYFGIEDIARAKVGRLAYSFPTFR